MRMRKLVAMYNKCIWTLAKLIDLVIYDTQLLHRRNLNENIKSHFINQRTIQKSPSNKYMGFVASKENSDLISII